MRNLTLAVTLVAMPLLACGPPQSAAAKNKLLTAATFATAAAGLMPTDCQYR